MLALVASVASKIIFWYFHFNPPQNDKLKPVKKNKKNKTLCPEVCSSLKHVWKRGWEVWGSGGWGVAEWGWRWEGWGGFCPRTKQTFFLLEVGGINSRD